MKDEAKEIKLRRVFCAVLCALLQDASSNKETIHAQHEVEVEKLVLVLVIREW